MNLIGNYYVGKLIKDLNSISKDEKVEIEKYNTFEDDSSMLIFNYKDIAFKLIGKAIEGKEEIFVYQKYIDVQSKHDAMLVEYNQKNNTNYNMGNLIFESELKVKRFKNDYYDTEYKFIIYSTINDIWGCPEEEGYEPLANGPVTILNDTYDEVAKIIYEFYTNANINIGNSLNDVGCILDPTTGSAYTTSLEGDVVYQL